MNLYSKKGLGLGIGLIAGVALVVLFWILCYIFKMQIPDINSIQTSFGAYKHFYISRFWDSFTIIPWVTALYLIFNSPKTIGKKHYFFLIASFAAGVALGLIPVAKNLDIVLGIGLIENIVLFWLIGNQRLSPALEYLMLQINIFFLSGLYLITGLFSIGFLLSILVLIFVILFGALIATIASAIFGKKICEQCPLNPDNANPGFYRRGN